MPRQSNLLLVALALAAGARGEESSISPELRECVLSSVVGFAMNFSGNEACPASCASCLTSPMDCLSACSDSRSTACGCARILPDAAHAIRACCDEMQFSFMASTCEMALSGMAVTVVTALDHMCEDPEGAARDAAPPGASLIARTKQSIVDGSLAVLAGLEAGARQHPGAGALLELVAEKKAAGAAYVSSHSQGAACLGMLEALEGEESTLAQQDPAAASEVPDLHKVAEQIASRSAGLLGREMPALKDKVHKAMTVAWSERGPGMDAEAVCRLVLQHHDAL